MKKNVKRFTTLFFVLLLIFMFVFSTGCVKKGGNKTNETSSVKTTDDNLYDEKGFLKDKIPAVSLNKEISILHWNDGDLLEFNAENNGGIINDAIYLRNLTTEERLKVKLKWTGVPGNYTIKAASYTLRDSSSSSSSGSPKAMTRPHLGHSQSPSPMYLISTPQPLPHPYPHNGCSCLPQGSQGAGLRRACDRCNWQVGSSPE